MSMDHEMYASLRARFNLNHIWKNFLHIFEFCLENPLGVDKLHSHWMKARLVFGYD